MLNLKEGYTPRWIVWLIDIAITALALFVAYLLRFDFSIPQLEIDDSGHPGVELSSGAYSMGNCPLHESERCDAHSDYHT
jgi:hypothetical protein